MRTLKVNPSTLLKSTGMKTGSGAFPCAENNFGDDMCMLGIGLKSAQVMEEEKLVKQLEEELERYAEATSSATSLNSYENSKFTSASWVEVPDLFSFPSTGLNSEDVHATCPASTSATTDLHKKLCSASRRVTRGRSCSSDSVPALNRIVNDILSLEVDFPVSGTSLAETSNNRATTARLKRGSTEQQARKQSKRQRSTNENVASTSAGSAVLSNSEDSDCEITSYIPAVHLEMESSEQALSNNSPGLRQCNAFPTDQNSADTERRNMRLDSLINMLNDNVQRIEDDIVIIDGSCYGVTAVSRKDKWEKVGTNNVRRVNHAVSRKDKWEVVGTNNVRRVNQEQPTVIVVSDDEGEPTVNVASNTQSRHTAHKSSPMDKSSSSKTKSWECPICLEKMSSERGIYATVCGHVFCKLCISKVMKRTKQCPKCRKELNNNKIHPLFVDGYL